MTDLDTEIQRRFRTKETVIDLGRRDVTIVHPANSDDLISETDFVRDERLPYWADIWPSSVIFARNIVEEDGRRGRLLELGCGSGLVSVAATIAGYDVTATDYYADALLVTQANVERNVAGKTVTTREVDWRSMPADLGHFPRVIAADVLYEPSYGDLVAEAIAATLAPNGRATVADPGRISRQSFLDAARRLGLRSDSSRKLPFVEGEIRQEITLIDLEWPVGRR